ncbi:tripartite tricarboxylate transporter substrate binding protein [Bradyrhizobium sp. 200]|uniref:Bug family tripartite tricarboxylate transporter substrate binding protein n=1 Tax=Bradyrhizobium sp. 200 TaxID=2782665 RepID=UPI001FFFAD46|nr:tripartite tricarboxylate transporter substrate binding protein [Bradyrhizobium sp. 200]UPJ48399.1 tripartite tricarboxylate transporter substrate binding protein [Bradyrhizobium sp. 200]
MKLTGGTSRVATLLIAACLFTLSADAGKADDYPSRYIRLVVPFAAGGTTDALARFAADELTKQLNKQVVVDNRGGANTALGVGEVIKAAPDGYTLLFVDASIAVSPNLLGDRFPFKPLSDLRPVALFATGQMVLLTSPDVPSHDLNELISYLKKNPDKLNYGSGGAGTMTYLCPEIFKREADTKIVNVAYRSAGPALTDLLAGVVQMMCLGVGNSAPFIDAGKLRAVAISGKSRSPRLPNVPTFAEAGLPSPLLDRATSWFAIFAKADTPDGIVTTLNSALVKMQESPALRERLSTLGFEAAAGQPAALAELVQHDAVTWGALIDKLGIRTD